MHANKTIGQAKYLKKDILQQYIPIRIQMSDTDCTKIQPMIDQSLQVIWSINKTDVA